MSRFETPEPSIEALAAYWNADRKPLEDNHEHMLRAAYAIDVPRIVKAEVERALALGGPGYVAERFGVPMNSATDSQVPLGLCGTGTAGAPGSICLYLRGHSGPHSWETRPGVADVAKLHGMIATGEPRQVGYGFISDAERAFLRALAKHWTETYLPEAVGISPTYEAVVDTARKVVES